MKCNGYSLNFQKPKELLKLLITLKLAVLFVFLSDLQVFGSLYSESTTLYVQLKNASLEDVFEAIESQSEFRFLYHEELISKERNLNLQIEGKTVEEILDLIFEDSNNTYSILDNNLVVITPRKAELLQGKPVNGTVTDGVSGEPLPGVTILIKGTTMGTITNSNGIFSIDADVNDTLQISYVGYLVEIIPVGNRTVIDLQLMPDIETLEEVVVVGYGTMKKSDVTGAIVSVKEEDFTQVKTTNVVESLQGKAAGVDIVRTSGEAGTDFDVRIRGERSLSGSNDPLYIVDGIQYGKGIDINPNDIESIEILKDIASTSIYGAKGANGVVIITTKQGTLGKPKITFSAYGGQSTPLGKIPFLDRDQYMQFKEDLAKFKLYYVDGIWPDSVDVTYEPFELEGIENGTNTDWFDLISRTGYLQNYFLGVSGGREGIAYNLSADYTKETGTLRQDDYQRYVIKGGFDVEVNKRLKVGTAHILSFKDRNRMRYPGRSIAHMNPLAEPYDAEGNIILNPTVPSNDFTPLWHYQEGYYTREELTTRVFSNLYVNINILRGFNFRSTLNVDYQTFREGLSEKATETQENVYMYIKPSRDYTWYNMLTFDRTYGIHHIQLTGVHEMRWGNTERYRQSGRNPSIPNSLWYAPSSWDAESISIELDENAKKEDKFYYSEESQLAFLGRINYGLLGRYIVTASLRYDGSSVLAKGNKWHYFPSASVAWNIADESFIKPIELISDLKFRFSYGVSGNYSVPVYSSPDRMNTDPLYYEFGTTETVIFGYRPVFAGNPDLGWEKTASYNLGIDFGIINNRIQGNIDLYTARTTDLLQRRTLPPHRAIPFIYANVGETQTRGIELMLRSIIFSSPKPGGFQWTMDISYTKSDEKIISLASGVDKDEANGWFTGYPIDVYYDYEKLGIWQFADSNEIALYPIFDYGMIKIKDQPGENGEIDTLINDADRVVVGTPRPKWYGSLNTRFDYKGFDLSILIMARVGQTVKDEVLNNYPIRDNYAENGMLVDYWTPVNPTNEATRLDPSYSGVSLMPYASTLQYTDGSWIKVRDITLGYTFPSSLTEKIHLSSLRLYFSAQNAIVLYSPLFRKGRYDPEMEGRTSWPTPKIFLLGLKVDF